MMAIPPFGFLTMRTQFYVFDPWKRDVSWITQEVIEEYCGALLRSPMAAENCIRKHSQRDQEKYNTFIDIVSPENEYIQAIMRELEEEYTIEYFIGKPKPLVWHIRQLELRMEMCKDPAEYTKMAKQLSDMNGWNKKPNENTVQTVSITVGGEETKLDRNNPRETQRIVMSVLGSVS